MRPPDTISNSVTRELRPVTANVAGPAGTRSVAGQPASVTATATGRAPAGAALAASPVPVSSPAMNTVGTATEARPAAVARTGARTRLGASTKASIGTA